MTDKPTEDVLHALTSLAVILQSAAPGKSLHTFWTNLSAKLDDIIGHTSCTVLGYDSTDKLLCRIYSSRPDIHKTGGRKRVTEGSEWAKTVLEDGEILIGSTADDIRRLFSEHEALIAQGWESILNIPVRDAGITIGSINIMKGPNAYDVYKAKENHALLRAFAHVCVPAVKRALSLWSVSGDETQLEYV